MNEGIEWRPKIGGRPATFSFLYSFPLHYLPLQLNHHTFGIEWRGFGHMA
jgi:hypothetical protein